MDPSDEAPHIFQLESRLGWWPPLVDLVQGNYLWDNPAIADSSIPGEDKLNEKRTEGMAVLDNVSLQKCKVVQVCLTS